MAVFNLTIVETLPVNSAFEIKFESLIFNVAFLVGNVTYSKQEVIHPRSFFRNKDIIIFQDLYL